MWPGVRRKVNVFLLGIPVALYLSQTPAEERGLAINIVIFVAAALSLLPLAGFVESAVEELAELLGQFIGGLLHTTFGNLAELAIGVLILVEHVQGGAEIVRASIAGSVIRNSLLFLGIATLMGAWRNGKMKFDAENASEYSTVFALAVIGLALPTVSARLPGFNEEHALGLSLALAGVLLLSYIGYVLFAVFRVSEGYNLVAHRQQRRLARQAQRLQRKRRHDDNVALPIPGNSDINALFQEERSRAEERLADDASATAVAVAAPARTQRKRIDPRGARLEAKLEERAERGESESGLLAGHPVWRGLFATLVLAVCATGVVVMSERFVGTIEPVAKQVFSGNELFIGLIVIPVIGGMVELTGAVGMARRNRMEITMGVTAGASIQMILLVAPVLVIVGHLVGMPFDLIFQPLPLAVFVASSFVFMLLGRDGESSWLEGIQLVGFWLLTASTAFFLNG